MFKGVRVLLGVCLVAAASHVMAREEQVELRNELVELKNVEAYLDGLRSLQATFQQIDPDGRVRKGTFYLQRPGKMRLKYEGSPQTVLADGNFLIFNNPDLDEVTQVPLDSTPAQFLLADHVSFGKDAYVTDFKEKNGKVYLSLVRADDPDAGRLTLIFRSHPLQLQEWEISDPNQRPTHVFLENVTNNVRLDPSLFTFDRGRY
ncbi:MAG: hypothetical protein C0514_08815 [Candidatus Puniceispirillum sp.]|nr:hypothetical protein [Candidatus Puniceispirillum sp.]